LAEPGKAEESINKSINQSHITANHDDDDDDDDDENDKNKSKES
jgi:hypothetical protein